MTFPGETPAKGDLRTLLAIRTVSAMRTFWHRALSVFWLFLLDNLFNYNTIVVKL